MASFMPFLHQMDSMQDYYNAYYGAVSSVEQGLLASKYKRAGFIWTGTLSQDDFSTLFGNKHRLHTTKWEVRARTNKIADNNINYLYWYTNDWNTNQNNIEKWSKLDYNKVAVIALSTDESKWFEDSITVVNKKNIEIVSDFKLPEKTNSDWVDLNVNTLADVNNITNGWFANSGLKMLKQDGMLYLWLDSSFKDEDGKKFPLLEYVLNFGDENIWDKKFKIYGEGATKNYTTELEVEKTTHDILSPDFKKTLFPENPKKK